VGTVAEGLVHTLPAATEGDDLTAGEVEFPAAGVIDFDIALDAKVTVVIDRDPGSHDSDPLSGLLTLLGCLQRVDRPWLASLGKRIPVGLAVVIFGLILSPPGDIDSMINSGKDSELVLAL
jgi:hypothetical protein